MSLNLPGSNIYVYQSIRRVLSNKNSKMKIKCGACGYETKVTKRLLSGVLGSALMSGGIIGWVTYAFAGLLGFSGGAGLIALTLIGGGGSLLWGKDLGLIIIVGEKIADIFNSKDYPCKECKGTDWGFSGFKNTEVIIASQHKAELAAAFRDARKVLFIASGFLSSYVVGKAFIKDLEAVLRKNVSVKLIFSDIGSHSDWMKTGYTEALSSLTTLSKIYPNLELIQKHTHQKGIIVDQQYVIVGSFNFLSNDKVARAESSAKIYDSEVIAKLSKEFLIR